MLYRVENQETKHGIWRDFAGNVNPVFDKLSDGQVRNLPMEDSDVYRQGGMQWFAAAPTKETLKHWFSRKDVEELIELGYRIYGFNVTSFIWVSEYEVIFRRDNILQQRELNIDDIWQD